MTEHSSPWLSSQVQSGVRIVSVLVPRIDAAAHPREAFAASIAEALGQADRRFVLDYSRVRTIDHACGILQFTFTAGQLLQGTDSRVAACLAPGHPRRAYRFAGLAQFVPDFRSPNHAAAAVARDDYPLFQG